ncbi:sensor domain-containing diguanylate cyclase [Butyrivibrio sp. AE3004]|uniref:sensor domain-containing diguanylate cyclase n=1 Tax=Butyrivibrio sp. AE3004 TaxID=1506994 RepID=UPI00068A9FDE|nr:diguanylate cyclase [Butyrivibrio sp. AE3004]
MQSRKNKVGLGRIVIYISALVIVMVIIIRIFNALYDVSKQNIIGIWRNRTREMAQEFSAYLRIPMDAVSFSAAKINAMEEEGTTTEEVGAYLINETETYAKVIRDNNTGVYGYYKGTYLDGSGWEPPEDYDPLSRPWYIDAVRGDGKIVAVKPYMNLQTFAYMMSISQLLDDKESVVSMDIYIDGVQKMMEDSAKDKTIKEAFVIDYDGYIIAHSEASHLEKHLYDDGEEIDKKIYDAILNTNDNFVDLQDYNLPDIAFVEDINGVWKTVVVLDKSIAFFPLRSIYMITGVFLLLAAAILLMIFLILTAKNRRTVELSNEVDAIADIYACVLKIDLKKDTLKLIRMNETRDDLMISQSSKTFKENARTMAETMFSDQSRNLVVSFMEPETLDARMQGVNSISQEFLDYKGCWMRIRFIAVEHDDKGKLSQVLLAFESIDEDRKRQESLRKKSETDSMTGIRNRGSGEAEIKRLMAEGRTGMFCLMDADNFKSINDNFGHKTGDKVIIAIAECMKSSFRNNDVVFRLGGDEFAAFSEGVISKKTGRLIIDRFFNNLDKISIPELGERKISMSVGASFYLCDNTDSFESLYTRADEGAYESKRREGSFVTFK